MKSGDNRPPFLTTDGKIEYLEERHYFPRSSITEDDVARLATVNFHFFIGYARNFRYLHDNGAITVQKSPSEVFRIMDADSQMSPYIFSGIRTVEFQLRHHFVNALCKSSCPYDDYLEPSNYLLLDSNYTPEDLIEGMLRDILNYREAYVVNHIERQCRIIGLPQPPRWVTRDNREQVLQLVQGLPIWSVVDSLTLGHLNRAILSFNPPGTQGPLWKEVSGALNFKADRFAVGCSSILFLRNLTAHHNRLWMRPTSNTPTRAGLFRKKMKDVDPRSMVVAFYNLASMHGASVARNYASGFEKLIDQNPAYAHGIQQISPD